MKEPTNEQIRSVMAALGKRTSEKKATAVRENGKKGGRPLKLIEVNVGPLLYDDYEKRDVFPFAHPGKNTLTLAQIAELVDDAKYQTGEDGPDEIPANYKRAYARLLEQLRA
jgi:hypothetical protein